jgi:hypothetical protein
MLRLTMKFWVQRCAGCGYCAPDLSADAVDDLPVTRVLDYDGEAATLEEPVIDPPRAWTSQRKDLLRAVVASNVYRAQLRNLSFPGLANSFLCHSLAAEAENRFVEATLGALHAAWACDDDPIRFKRASQCRSRVIDMIQGASRRGQKFGAGPESAAAILVDALRRTGNFESAATTCQEALGNEPDERLRRVLQFQLSLVDRRSKRAYSLADAARWSPKAGD